MSDPNTPPTPPQQPDLAAEIDRKLSTLIDLLTPKKEPENAKPAAGTPPEGDGDDKQQRFPKRKHWLLG